jgi:hypothetical protein
MKIKIPAFTIPASRRRYYQEAADSLGFDVVFQDVSAGESTTTCLINGEIPFSEFVRFVNAAGFGEGHAAGYPEGYSDALSVVMVKINEKIKAAIS